MKLYIASNSYQHYIMYGHNFWNRVAMSWMLDTAAGDKDDAVLAIYFIKGRVYTLVSTLHVKVHEWACTYWRIYNKVHSMNISFKKLAVKTYST